MDKYEFNIKTEQIRKLVGKGDFATAMKITDTIDWRKVRNTNLLSMVSLVYEKNGEYQDAKDILLLAFERAPIGKRLLYKLTELALKEGNLEEAEAYYREFCDLAADDPRQHLLRYLILKEKDAPLEQRIHSLEGYTAEELDEKWLYELAELYHKAGDSARCVSACDKIMLMFGLGKYVDKAMELKLEYAPLTKYQMDLVENREKYEEKLRAVEQSFQGVAGGGDEYLEDLPDQEMRPPVQRKDSLAQKVQPSVQDDPLAGEMQPPVQGRDPLAREMQPPVQEDPLAGEMQPLVQGRDPLVREKQPPVQEDLLSGEMQTPAQRVQLPDREARMPAGEMRVEGPDGPEALYIDEQPDRLTDDNIRVELHQAEVEENLKREMSRMPVGEPVEENELGKTRILTEIHRRSSVKEEPGPQQSGQGAEMAGEPAKTFPENQSAAESSGMGFADEGQASGGPAIATSFNHLMIEARTPDKGLVLAKELLRRIRKETGLKNPVVKITGSKLSKRGLMANLDKLAGKDLMIEEAGDLTPKMIGELEQFMAQDTVGVRVILIDNPRQMEILQAKDPSLFDQFEYFAAVDGSESDDAGFDNANFSDESAGEERAAEPEMEEEADAVPEIDDRPVRRVVPVRDGAMRVPDQQELRQDVDLEDMEPEEEEMNIDDFAQYACQYATGIDCSITGKSMLALYERIEIMEEDGIPLTRTTAKELIEEAADRAEKPSLGKAIKGIFSSKYDKDGMLILKEEHFI